jgi:ribonuclease HI
VKGHAGDEGNERADALANAGAARYTAADVDDGSDENASRR